MKKLIHNPDFGLLVLRVFTGLAMAFAHGLKKIPPAEGFINAIAQIGFPLPTFFAWSAGLAEFAGGLLIAVGLFTRHASLFLGFTMAVAAFGAHAADPFSKQELSLLYLAVCVLIVFQGAGRFSLDRMLRKI
jgi:putative oxidoreductase